jgi:hypothetical protein
MTVGQPTFETEKQSAGRSKIQERIWNYVWVRRVVYFLTLAATIHIAAFWLFHPLVPSHEFDNRIRLVSETVRLIGSLLPNSLHWWTDWYATNPEWFAGGLLACVVLGAVGTTLSARISDLMRIVWGSRGATDPTPKNIVQNVIFALRRNPAYRWLIWFGRMHFLPFLFFPSVVWFVLTFGSHLLFNIADSMGVFCRGDEAVAIPVNLGADQQSPIEFATSHLCVPT